ncbi:DHA2 family efflux MFS transporter permease subunit [Mycobacterium spongiae]|uniref:DHA2 family efflux MFS transporter permease subunit n=1 Tax=Mycobacterium spongiae TaxID=886343 RepID=A0A975K1J4_9MYCO|nr:DHA2 family efflux MFS transporter permease subunit [Mycobacterium spongiae]QUR69363.1 DHA2 family efflux MFS transporter permease subunit [Mycobacterium spongiae]
MSLASRRAAGRVRPTIVLAVVCLGVFIAGIDMTIVNVALPTLARDVKANNAQLQWTVDAYTLTAAGLLLFAGTVGDRYGRRGSLHLGLAIFATMSAVAAWVTSAEALIAARAVMGLGAAFIVPTTLALITNIFIDPIQRAKAIGLWSAMAAMGVAIGPIAGGWLLQNFWLGSIFLVNVPVAAVAMVGASLFVPTSRDPAPAPLDVAGLVLSAMGVTALTYTIIEAPHAGWISSRTAIGFTAAAIGLAAFAWHERRIPHPMLDLSIFANRRFGSGILAVSSAHLALFGFIFVMTQYLQFVAAYTPFETGERLLPVALAAVVASVLAPRFVERLGTTTVVVAGLGIFAVAIAWSGTFRADTSYVAIAVAMALFGSGLGFTIASATESIMGSLSLAHSGVGAAVASASRQLAGSLGVAIVGSIFASVYTRTLDRSASLGDMDPEARGAMRQSMAAAQRVIDQLPTAQTPGIGQAVADAFLSGMWVSCLVCAGTAMAAATIIVVRVSRS